MKTEENKLNIHNHYGIGLCHNVTMFEQHSEKLCWASVTEAIAHYFKITKYTQDILKSQYKSDEYDPFLLLKDIYNIKKKQLKTCIETKPTLTQVKNLIRTQGPLVFTIHQGNSDSILHYILVVGYINIKEHGNFIIIKDPYPKEERFSHEKKCVEPTLVDWKTFRSLLYGFLYTTPCF